MTHGVVVGLVVGKLVGISVFTWLAVRLGVARLPDRTNFAQIVGVAALGGIGFTVSLFVSELAFGTGSVLNDDAKIGVLAASVIAAVLGVVILLATTRGRSGRTRRRGPPKRAPRAAERWCDQASRTFLATATPIATRTSRIRIFFTMVHPFGRRLDRHRRRGRAARQRPGRQAGSEPSR